MSIQENFEKFAKEASNLKETPSDADLLELYGLYKQATVGDCNTDKPGFFDFKGKSKWEAWNSRKGIEKEEAMKSYIEKVESLINSIGLKE